MDRLFCALCLPENLSKRISEHIGQIKPALQQARPVWTGDATYHITLHFFGEVDATAWEFIRIQLAKEEFRHSRPRLQASGHLLFPNRVSPRVLSLSFHCMPDGCLVPLVQQIRLIARDAGAEQEKRPWKPHLTLARLKNPVFINPQSFPRPPLFEFDPETFDLIKSDLTPQGPHYTTIQRYRFC